MPPLGKKGEDQQLARLATMRQISQATGGMLPPYLVYCGSVTGRFSGGGKLNVQNLGRAGLGAQIRGLLVAKPGHVFVIADFAQIEARITAWYSGQRDAAGVYREAGPLRGVRHPGFWPGGTEADRG